MRWLSYQPNNNYEMVNFQTIPLLKGYYNNNQEILINNSILNPILTPDTVIDLASASNIIDSNHSSPRKRKGETNKNSPSSSKKIKM